MIKTEKTTQKVTLPAVRAAPVSYTHLDVYKRQIYRRCCYRRRNDRRRNAGRRRKKQKDDTMKNAGRKEKRLDVYKRQEPY